MEFILCRDLGKNKLNLRDIYYSTNWDVKIKISSNKNELKNKNIHKEEKTSNNKIILMMIIYQIWILVIIVFQKKYYEEGDYIIRNYNINDNYINYLKI